ncbi:CHASE2 domain-containing protein [Candidatus Nitronereus thalassa]|uniref:CHASE2 domain-containing protein n=1 Tax=Candidatus Nitronereus thalassa TaxID=3020898 RepID=A0ABU3KC65_9BACT|nr:CHASE2 domain-containing protein [Candidatus Nitronereus thalassa]MDT7043983.1 CHASE2 domain-containing protein [Candidatus Nitronereus thalassa]
MKHSSVEKLIQIGYRYVTRSKGRFYLYLAVFCSLLVILDAGSTQLVSGMKLKTFDVIMKNRLLFHQADSNIVIIDIDEGSLAAMATDYGRWPWPRQVFAEFLEILQEQEPEAVVFDILFSDPDIYNPDSDAYFNEVVGMWPNTFFPMLRLAPQNDDASQVTPGMIPGMGTIPGQSQLDKGMAVVLPSFSGILASGRIGTNNVYPDRDGIVRQYPIFRNHHGWRIPSLPAKIGDTQGWTLPQKQDVFLNWRGKPGAFQSVRFSEVFQDFLRRDRQRPSNEFTSKIVIIGSTASALFDTKPTPMARIHPGVEILATAIDNLKNGDWITQVKNPWMFTLLALGLIWGTAFAFMTGVNRKWIDGIFASSQAGLIGVTFASLNFSTFYVDLTAPITTGLIYFSLARVYAYAEATLMEKYVWLNVEEGVDGWQHAEIMVLHVEDLPEASESHFLTAFKRDLNNRKPGFTVEAFPRKPAGIGRAYHDMFLIYYVESAVKNGQWVPRTDGNTTRALVQEEAQALCAKEHRVWRIGFCQGALPYGQEKGRIQAWQHLVMKSMLDLREQETRQVS